jgi:hypothetical protein
MRPIRRLNALMKRRAYDAGWNDALYAGIAAVRGCVPQRCQMPGCDLPGNYHSVDEHDEMVRSQKAGEAS